MLLVQYRNVTGNEGARGEGQVAYRHLENNQVNQTRLQQLCDMFAGQTVSYKEIKAGMDQCPAFCDGADKMGDGGKGNWLCAMWHSLSHDVMAPTGITRIMSGKKTTGVVFPAKAAPVKARKGKAKVQQATLPGLE